MDVANPFRPAEITIYPHGAGLSMGSLYAYHRRSPRLFVFVCARRGWARPVTLFDARTYMAESHAWHRGDHFMTLSEALGRYEVRDR